MLNYKNNIISDKKLKKNSNKIIYSKVHNIKNIVIVHKQNKYSYFLYIFYKFTQNFW